MLLTVASVAMATPTPVSIPQAKGTYINFTNADLDHCSSSDGVTVGSTGASTVITYALTNTTEQEYYFTMKSGARDCSSTLSVTIKDDGVQVGDVHYVNVVNTSSANWDLSTIHLFSVGVLPISNKLSMVIKVESNEGSYAGNFGGVALYNLANLYQIPSAENVIPLASGAHQGAKTAGGEYLGYISSNTYSEYAVYNSDDMYANILLNIKANPGGGTMTAKIYDFSDLSTPETQQTCTISTAGENVEFELTQPISQGFKKIRFDYSPSGSYLMDYKDLRITKRSDYVPPVVKLISNLTIDGEAAASAVLNGVNADGESYTLTGNIYTTMPTVTATFNDATDVTVTPSLSGSDATYTLTGEDFASTLIIEGVHVYAPTGSEKTVDIKANAGTIDGATWTNGIYSLVANIGHNSYNECFKDKGTTYTLSIPSDIVVKQLILKDIRNNYKPKGAYVSGASSTGATAYVPTKNQIYHADEGSAHDVLINIDGHSAGQDVVFNLAYTGSDIGEIFFWIQLTTLGQDPGTNPTSTAQTATISDNDAVVAVTFDREIASDVTASIAGQTVKAKGGASVLYFPVWNLDYSSNNTLTIAAGAATDNYGNKNASAINVAVNIPAKAAVTPAVYDYVVSNKSELDAAITALQTSNRTAEAVRKTIFIKNGTYDYDFVDGSYQYGLSLKIDNWNHIYNVSLIGESRDSVIITSVRKGVTSATVNLGDGTGNYVQDMTFRNTDNTGVAPAMTGGNKTILKNVRLLSTQDTYVTGKRTYHETCDIYGTVDFICGGGDHFFDHCNLIVRGGGYVTAPATDPSLQWGYVFDHNTIQGEDAGTVDGSYSLGRPWQNEPRAYFLNTDMQVLCATGGWAGMSELVTHFYEYNTLHNGSAVDLNGRTNSSTSTNHYTPVLSAQEAAEFTVHNVLGGTDAWDAQADAAQVAAPQNISASAHTLKWNAVADALLYVVLKDGAYVANTISTTYDVAEDGVYTVKAANKFGGLGEASASVTISTGTYVRAFANSYLNTLCFPYQIDTYTGATFYTLQYKEVENEVVTNIVLDEVEADAPLAAGTPYFYLPNDGADELVCNYSGEALENPLSAINGVQGIFALQTVPENDYVTYQGQIRKAGTNVTLHEYRAYIHMDAVSDVPTPASVGRRRMSVRIIESTTGIESQELKAGSDLQKLIKNGQLLIIRDGRTYNALGQLVD